LQNVILKNWLQSKKKKNYRIFREMFSWFFLWFFFLYLILQNLINFELIIIIYLDLLSDGFSHLVDVQFCKRLFFIVSKITKLLNSLESMTQIVGLVG
jgi:hypothetical protein